MLNYSNIPHSDRKLLKQALNCTFDQVYECLLNLQDKMVTNLKTSRGNTFFAIAAESSEVGNLFSYRIIIGFIHVVGATKPTTWERMVRE